MVKFFHGLALVPALLFAGSPAPLGRFLLVASEGLYVVEPDGKPSWTYHPEPYRGQGWVAYDDLIYDGWALPNGRFLYATHRYVREVDRDKRTVWEYRVKGKTEVKTCVPLPNGRVAVLNSEEQAILELESGTGKVLHRIALPAEGNDHTRYNSMRRTPDGNYLVALRKEERFVEVTRKGEIVRSFAVSGLPIVAQRLEDGSTLASGGFGVVRFDRAGTKTWTFTKADSSFPLIYASGATQLSGGRILVANSDWHYANKGDNRVQVFVVDQAKKVSFTIESAAFDGWKKGEVEPRTGFTEHRVCLVQPLP